MYLPFYTKGKHYEPYKKQWVKQRQKKKDILAKILTAPNNRGRYCTRLCHMCSCSRHGNVGNLYRICWLFQTNTVKDPLNRLKIKRQEDCRHLVHGVASTQGQGSTGLILYRGSRVVSFPTHSGKKANESKEKDRTAGPVQTEGRHYGTEAVGKRKADWQKSFSVKLNTHLPVCTTEGDQSVQSDTVSWFFP